MRRRLIAVLLSLVLVSGVTYVGLQSPEPQQESVEEVIKTLDEIIYLSEQDFSLLYSYHKEERIPDEIDITQSEAELLMKVARAEAGAELIPQMWVMATILNRIKSDNHDFKDIETIGQAIYQKGQFQVVTKGTFETIELNENSHIALAEIESGWNETDGSLYFKASSDKSTWHDENLTFITEIAGQKYYK